LLLPVTFAHRDPEEDAKLHRTVKLAPHAFSGGLGEDVIATGEPLCLPETSSLAVAGNLFPEVDSYLGRFPSVGLLITPIVLRGRTAGLMTTIREVTSSPLNDEDVSFASEVATRAGIAIGQLNLFNELQKELQERARVEEALHDTQTVFYQITQSLREVLWIRDMGSQRFTYVSPGYEAIWGRSCDSLYQEPRSFLDSVHPDDRLRVEEETVGGKALLTKVHEYRVVRPSGEVRWVVARRFMAPGEAGSGPRIIGLVEDITERKEMEAQSRRLEEELRLLARRLDAAREEERRKLSLWIHDEIGQMLTAVRMDLSWVHRKLPARNPELKARLVELQGLLEENIGAVQRVTAELRPTLLEDLGLKAAVEWQLEQFARRTGITTELEFLLEESELDRAVSLVLFRIVQEALTNVARHAQASSTRVELEPCEEGVRLQVVDNGRGIREEEAAGPGALGILGMRERIAAHGGKLEIRARRSGGTALLVTIPTDRTANP
jgi:PAS domain S-box-containing protein